MPFDVVWLHNFRGMTPLVLKNLIGRAGRTSAKIKGFNFGYVIANKRNVATLKARLNGAITLSDRSALDSDLSEVSGDLGDLVEAIRDDTYNDDFHLPEVQVDRIRESGVDADIGFVLDNLMRDGMPLTGTQYHSISKPIRSKIKDHFKKVYVSHLKRRDLTKAEMGVLSTAIPIMLWHIQGKSFSEIVSLRHAYISQKEERRQFQRLRRRGEITRQQELESISALKPRFTTIASQLPNVSAPSVGLFPESQRCDKLSYDAIVYDTYDYLDKVVSFSLSDPLCAAFILYGTKHSDSRAFAMANYIRYGTDDPTEIWLLKYGFGFEDIAWLKEHVDSIDDSEIVFSPSVIRLDPEKRRVISRYV